MRLYAFQGTHYAAGPEATGGDPGRLIAPPYDQINDAQRDRLHALDPHHFAHLIKPVAADGVDAYSHAAALHDDWLARGAVVEDPVPALYPYVIELAGGGRRLGLMALVGLEPPEAGIIRPHEQTLDKPLADRLDLLRTTRVDLEPALLLADDAGALDRLLAEDVAGSAPLVVHTDADGHRHAIHRLDDPKRIRLYQQLLDPLPAAIADGHHRYKTGLLYSREIGARPGDAAAAKLAVVTSLQAEHLTIDPIHRALKAFAGFEALSSVALRRSPWQPAADSIDPGGDFAHAVAVAPQPALGLWVSGARPAAEIWTLDRHQVPAHVPASAAGLSVVLLQEVVYPRLGFAASAATDGTVIYRSNPAELHRMVVAGEIAAGLWLPPMTPVEFGAAIAHGDLLPPKSTRFLPKVFSGLVWAQHDARLG